MGRRFALVVNALAGDELVGGRADAKRMYTLLCDEELGDCDPASPAPLQDCATRGQFQEVLISLLKNWDHQDQLILYFSGHGSVKHNKYTLVFGEKPNETYLPFDNVTGDLQAYGVSRSIIILDACQSGAALKQGQKSTTTLEASVFPDLPQGIAVLASCRESESSYELDDGRGSVFTHLLTKGVRSGLGGKSTNDGLIGPHDITQYIAAKLVEDEFSGYPQSPAFCVYAADRQVWLSRNRTREIDEQPVLPPSGSRTVEELRLLYEKTEKSRWPCPGPDVADLDETLIRKYASASGIDEEGISTQDLCRKLGLYSTLEASTLHRAAVLCFAHKPSVYVPQARAMFSVGSHTSTVFRRDDILGPLSLQVRQLFDFVQQEVARRHRYTAYNDTQRVFFQVVREAISNAVTHRDYERSEVVRVSVNFPTVEILSPGAFPADKTFDSLLHADHVSSPKDAAIAWYLTTLLSFEGIGRGFTVFEDYVLKAGEDHLDGSQTQAPHFIRITATFPVAATQSVGEPVEDTVAEPEKPAPLVFDPGPGGAPPPPTPGKVQADSVTMLPSARPRPDIEVTRVSTAEGAENLPFEKLGHYRIEGMIARGASGAVYLALDERLERQVVIKMLSMRFDTAEALSRFEREARIYARLNHPCIVSLYDIGSVDDLLYLVMEYVEGESLEQFLRSAASRDDEPDDAYFEWVARIAAQVAVGLAHAHEHGVIHRDVKPSNILLDKQANARVSDFGISKDSLVGEDMLTVEGAIVGTPAYMAPEQAEVGGVDPRTDVYSLGIVLYQLLTGRLPYAQQGIVEVLMEKARNAPRSPRSVNPRVPRVLDEICMRAVQPRLEDRFDSAHDMAKALLNYQTDEQGPGFGFFKRLFRRFDT